MEITISFKKGTLNQATKDKFYAVLRQIEYLGRVDASNAVYELGQNYIFEGKLGTVTVTFEQSDMV